MIKVSSRFDISIVILMCGFAVIVVTMIWHISSLQSRLLKESALNTARLFSKTLTEVRNLYTTDVVKAAAAHGMNVTHDYLKNENAIPLPATFSMRLGELIGKNGSNVKMRLYSAYPFPWRVESGGLADDFSKKAWDTLSRKQREPFIQFVESDRGMVLRYATADVMRPGCIDCHNTHPQSPKRDWKVGDLRGILEITLPLESGSQQVDLQIRSIRWIYSAVGLLMLAGIGFAHYRVRHSRNALMIRSVELEAANTKLKNLSEIDDLTGISNRRHYDRQLITEISNARRAMCPISMLVIDIDYFKQYNDGYGHQLGDRILKRVAEIAKSSLTRETDYIARYGGDEFVVILPFTDAAGAFQIAELIRERIAAENMAHEFAKRRQHITVSIGIASQACDGTEKDDLFEHADSALYKAKEQGRDCCVVDLEDFN